MSWQMFAGPVSERVNVRLHVDESAWMVEAYGDVPSPVTVVEDPEGAYLGWIDTGTDSPVMIQPEYLFAMQFPYGPESAEAAGKGKVVRLRVDAA